MRALIALLLLVASCAPDRERALPLDDREGPLPDAASPVAEPQLSELDLLNPRVATGRDGGAIVAGVLRDCRCVVVTRIDANGREVWRRTLTGAADDVRLLDVGPADEIAFIVVAPEGVFEGVSRGSYGTLAVALEPNGAVRFVRTFDRPAVMTAIRATSDGVVVGGYTNPENEAVAVKYDRTGAVVWQRAIPARVAVTAIAPDERLYLEGSGDLTALGAGAEAPHTIVALDSDARVLFARSLFPVRYANIARFADEGGLTIGNSRGEDYEVVRLSAGGEVAWRSTLATGVADGLHELTRSADGFTAVTGTGAFDSIGERRFSPKRIAGYLALIGPDGAVRPPILLGDARHQFGIAMTADRVLLTGVANGTLSVEVSGEPTRTFTASSYLLTIPR